MVVYDVLSRFPLLKKSYTFKFLSVAFLGVHVPLIGICIYFALSGTRADPFTIIVFILGLTLASTAFTLIVLNKLLDPLKLGKTSLDIYLKERRMPELPVHYEDEAGILLANINKTVEKLDGLVMEKTGVIDLLSHDLRSPLARIIGLSQVQKIDHKAGPDTLYADEIIGECNHALALLTDVLNLLKHEELANRNIPLQKMFVYEIISRSIASLDVQSKTKNITWRIEIDPAQQADLEPTLFTQAIKNVLTNAIKFSIEGGAITIHSKVSGTLLYVAVEDEGIGFDTKDKDLIFNRFTKSGRTGTMGESSTGLGLYLSKKIAQRHGGELIAESGGTDLGATFTFILPYTD
ncbi:hypothetical protein CJD36_011360 [Flavipsychrobacter stenotrophus]|uniref:histidine kinase n=1 Tax=Flavipsychrobacter stenotrophus TaxID=2077091 RepID=A0A2S7SVD4_9BACT|nr:HAMP domain-containing sensor histidine kinase [Flavipsychrobacter stenotrophus]PQJ10565.1 hypothetical protein CJD36_011360 [Flavipsychrobacter stenotrophus]